MIDKSFITSYKKNLGKNYMIIDCQDDIISGLNTDFRIRMLHENNIPGLLNTHVQYTDDIPSFQYDITGLQSLEVILDTTPLTHTLLCKIFSAIYNTLLSMEDYLLLNDHVLLIPEYIYLTADYSDIRLCYCPIMTNSFTNTIRTFFEYLLKRVDHLDEKCVYLAYSMHKATMEHDFNIDKLYIHLSSIPKATTPTSTLCEDIQPKLNNDITTSILPENSKNTLNANSLYTSISYEDRHVFEGKIKIIILISLATVSIIISTILYFFDTYTISFYGILLLTIAIIVCYNRYHLHRQYTPNKQKSHVSSNQPRYDSSTVLLAAAADDNTHKLIYTGIGDGEDISLTHYPFVIGKTESCSAKLSNSTISRLHAKISLLPAGDDSDEIIIEDLNSTNGTLLNNKPLTPYEKYPINSGDYITFGHLTYIFR